MTIVHHNMTRAQVEELVANAGSKFIRVEEWCGEIVFVEPRWIELLRETALPDPVDPNAS